MKQAEFMREMDAAMKRAPVPPFMPQPDTPLQRIERELGRIRLLAFVNLCLTLLLLLVWK